MVGVDLLRQLLEAVGRAVCKCRPCSDDKELSEAMRELDETIAKLQRWLELVEAGVVGSGVKPEREN